jgi:amino acid adenylation domain-containing protein/non-ribosomal peptide synthase protein (TIGR01720 family)
LSQVHRGDTLPPITPVNRDQPLSLSFAQERLWFLDQLIPDNPFYNTSAAVRLLGVLNVAALEKSLREIVQRHETLRTTFQTVNGKPVQVIHPLSSRHYQLSIINLPDLPKDQLTTEVQRLATSEAQRTFDLKQAPLCRTALLVLSPDEYVLQITLHHIATDGWSMGIFVRELSTLYEAFSTDAPFSLPKLPIQYVDFALWQRQWLSGPVLETQQNYWQQKLADAPYVLEIRDHPRPPVHTFRGGVEYFEITPALTEQLKSLGLKSGATLFMTSLAAFAILIGRYSGQKDFLIGAGIANRHRQEIESLIGFFVNTLALRIDLSDDMIFMDLLTQVRQITLEAYAHQDLPFEQLVEVLQLQRDMSRNPLVQVSLIFQNAPMPSLTLADLEVSRLEFENATVRFDLEFHLWEESGCLKGHLYYYKDLFEANTIARMLEHFQILLTSAATQPEQPISTFSLLNDAERQQLLVAWNNTAVDYPRDKTIVDLFEAQAEKTPNNVAVVFEEQSVTYQQLNARANQLAHHLQVLGVKPEVLVGICVERSLEMVIGVLGILKAGGAYVPLDPAYPAARLTFMLEDAQVLLTQSSLTEKLPETKAKVVCLDVEALSQLSEKNVVSGVSSENLAYIIYTSGSTGTPKGVMVRHQPVINLIEWVNKTFQVGSSDRILFVTSLCFDLSVYDIFGLLAAGGSIHIASKSVLKNPEQLLHTLYHQPITFWDSVPAFFQQLVPFITSPHNNSLRLVFLSGDWIPVTLPDTIKTAFPMAQVIGLGGATEATVWSNYYPIETVNQKWVSIPYGKPIANAKYYILDQNLNPCPIGILGSLYIGGECLASGYNDPLQTAQRFIPDPFSEVENARLYHTGDLARYLFDGNIEFLGRIDNQVKIRGFRIELSEIEAVLAQHPFVKENAVIVHEISETGKRLVAYIVVYQGQVIENTILRSFLKERLPDYMIPSAFVALDTLPLTPNGKIDRQALSQLSVSHYQLSEKTFVAPRTPEEELLAGIWAKILGIPRVGIHDNLFELGGDSILIIQVISHANQVGMKLTPQQLFQFQTIAELAKVAQHCDLDVQIEQGLVSGKVPLTPIQHWFFEQELPEPHHFNQSLMLEVSSNLTPDLLKPIMSQLLRHHDALRLRFVEKQEQWITSDESSLSSDLCVVITDLSNLEPEQQKTAIESQANDLQKSLNLSEGPLLQVVLFLLGHAQPNRLLFIVHHLAIDGVSWRILLEDFTTMYQQLQHGETPSLPSKTSSFKQWAGHLTEYAQSQRLEAELKFWLTSSQVKSLPVDNLSGKNTLDSQAKISVCLSVEQTHALLQQVPPVYNTQINDILLTALGQSLLQWTGEPTLLIDVEGHGREELFDDIDLSRTVGWFTSLFPVLLHTVSQPPGEALKSIKEQLRQLPHHGIGYGLFRYLNAKTAKSLQAQPKAQVSFNYLGQFGQTFSEEPLLGVAQESSGEQQSQLGYRHHCLDLNGFIVQDQFHLEWTYSRNLHHQATIENLAHNFLENLQALIAHCLSPEAGGYTPSDFPDTQLSQIQLDDLLNRVENGAGFVQRIEAIYPLSPSQLGMLIETLSSAESGFHIEQFIWRLQSKLDITAFEQAWQHVVDCYPVLRTAFVWQALEEPLQIVFKQVKMPVMQQDWQGLTSSQQQEQLDRYLQNERHQGFNLTQVPLMRLALFQVDEDVYDMVWTYHHILMDGWGLPLLQKELLRFLEALKLGQTLVLEQPVQPYQNYIRWLKQQDLLEAERFWQQTLQGFKKPTPLGILSSQLTGTEEPQAFSQRYDRQQAQLSSEETARLESLARQHHLTLNVLIQGVWSLLLNRYSGDCDLVFGATTSGRPAEISGIELMLGLFINTVPVRVKITQEALFWDWLVSIQTQNQARVPYEYCSAGQVHQWSDMPGALPLYESLLVFENYPVDQSSLQHFSALGFEISATQSVGAQTQNNWGQSKINLRQ